jgi:hypothetical protein
MSKKFLVVISVFIIIIALVLGADKVVAASLFVCEGDNRADQAGGLINTLGKSCNIMGQEVNTPDVVKWKCEKCAVRDDCTLTRAKDAFLICSTNNFNTCTTQVCLVKMGQPCDLDYQCEGGTICDQNSKVCKVDTGDTTLAGPLGSTTTDIRDAVRRFINIALGFLGVITVVMIIYGGVLWLTAAGAEDKVTKGKHTLIWAAVGAIVISIAWTISSYVLQIGKTVG